VRSAALGLTDDVAGTIVVPGPGGCPPGKVATMELQIASAFLAAMLTLWPAPAGAEHDGT
jgi:hypothetical protein